MRPRAQPSSYSSAGAPAAPAAPYADEAATASPPKAVRTVKKAAKATGGRAAAAAGGSGPTFSKATPAAAAGGARRGGAGKPSAGGPTKLKSGLKKDPADPLVLARQEIAALQKEVAAERDRGEQRLEALTSEANARMDEYEGVLTRMEAELREAHTTIEERDAEIVRIERERDERIARLERERDARYQQYEEFLMVGEKMRAELHNALIELKGNIRVFARVRPALEKELRAQQASPAPSKEHFTFPEGTDHRGLTVVDVPAHAGVLGKKANTQQMNFNFDKVFDQDSSQSGVFQEISQLVQSALDGYKVCIFAYGQTGSGKTFTMEGPEPGVNSEASGMIPRAVRQIFDNCQWKSKQSGFKYRLFCSFIQIYNDTIHDMLNPADAYTSGPGNNSPQLKHEIRNTETESIVTNIKEEEVCWGLSAPCSPAPLPPPPPPPSWDSTFPLLQCPHSPFALCCIEHSFQHLFPLLFLLLHFATHTNTHRLSTRGLCSAFSRRPQTTARRPAQRSTRCPPGRTRSSS